MQFSKILIIKIGRGRRPTDILTFSSKKRLIGKGRNLQMTLNIYIHVDTNTNIWDKNGAEKRYIKF